MHQEKTHYQPRDPAEVKICAERLQTRTIFPDGIDGLIHYLFQIHGRGDKKAHLAEFLNTKFPIGTAHLYPGMSIDLTGEDECKELLRTMADVICRNNILRYGEILVLPQANQTVALQLNNAGQLVADESSLEWVPSVVSAVRKQEQAALEQIYPFFKAAFTSTIVQHETVSNDVVKAVFIPDSSEGYGYLYAQLAKDLGIDIIAIALDRGVFDRFVTYEKSDERAQSEYLSESCISFLLSYFIKPHIPTVFEPKSKKYIQSHIHTRVDREDWIVEFLDQYNYRSFKIHSKTFSVSVDPRSTSVEDFNLNQELMRFALSYRSEYVPHLYQQFTVRS